MIDNQVVPMNYGIEQNYKIPLYFWKAYQVGIAGVEICHVATGASESSELVSQQHALFLHLRPEFNSERRVNNRLQVENVQVGDVGIVPAHVTHWHRIGQEVSEVVIVTLEPQFFAQSTSELVSSDRVELLPTYALQADPLIYGIGLTLKNALETGIRDRVYTESLLTCLSIHLLRNYSTQTPLLRDYIGGLSQYQLQQVRDFILSHLDQDIQLADLAQTVSMSRYYFIKLFKQSTGFTPHQYLLQQRIHRAKELLAQQRGIAIVEVALQCGFSNQSHFTRLFRQLVGTTPKVYRASRL